MPTVWMTTSPALAQTNAAAVSTRSKHCLVLTTRGIFARDHSPPCLAYTRPKAATPVHTCQTREATMLGGDRGVRSKTVVIAKLE